MTKENGTGKAAEWKLKLSSKPKHDTCVNDGRGHAGESINAGGKEETRDPRKMQGSGEQFLHCERIINSMHLVVP